MTERKITILGEEVAISFNMAVEIAYEDISGDAFDVDSLKSQKNSIALYMAAIIANNPDTEITVDRLLKEAKAREITALSQAVIQSMLEWLEIPTVMKKTEDEEPKPEETTDEAPKN